MKTSSSAKALPGDAKIAKNAKEALQPTAEMLKAMRLVETGADIFAPDLARTLRAVERDFPDLIKITKYMGTYGVRQVHPYFGAILTGAGKASTKHTPSRSSRPSRTKPEDGR